MAKQSANVKALHPQTDDDREALEAAGIAQWLKENRKSLEKVDILLDLSEAASDLTVTPEIADLGADGAWVRESGVTPLEFLVRFYRHPLQKPADRVAAARAVLEYAHKKTMAMKLDGKLKGSAFGSGGIDPGALSKLSDKELAQFVALLEKLEA